MIMPFKCSNGFKTVFDHLRLSFYAINTVFLCENCVKYQYAGLAVCAYAHVYQKQPGCALIGACALIRTNMVGTYTMKTYHKPSVQLFPNRRSLSYPN